MAVPVIADAASCNGRFSNSTFFPTGAGNIYRVGGSHDPTETVTFTIASGVMSTLSIQLEGGAMLCSTPAACDGYVFTATAAQDYFFSISGKAGGGANAVVNANCQAASTGPDTDGGSGQPPAQGGSAAPLQSGQSALQQSAAVKGLQNAINGGRLPTSTIGGASGSAGGLPVTVAPTGGLGGSNGLDLGFSSSGLPTNANTPGASSALSVWTQMRFTQLTSDDTGIEGPVLDVRVGLEYEAASGVTVGGHGSFMAADVSSVPLSTNIEETRFGGGMHVRLDLLDNISATADVMYEAGTADITSFGASGSAGVSRLAASASLQGSFVVNSFVLSPRGSVGVIWHERDSYTNSAGTVVGVDRDTEMTGLIGLRAGYPVAMEEGIFETVTPFIDASLFYFSEGDTDLFTVTGTTINDSTIGGGLEAGLEFEIAGGGAMGFSAGLTGIGRDTMGLTAAAHLQLPLN
ncbi:MAG: autotransporter outer membrane beta-barrel domain-containing protein [Pseudomonadota bacterium]